MPPTGSHLGNSQTWYRAFPGTPDHVRECRRFIRAHLPHHPDAELVASELATNTLLHTASGHPGGVFGVRIELRADNSARLEFEDAGGPPEFGTPKTDREGGRGLTLVEVLTTAWGIKGDTHGRTVWTEFQA